MNDTQHETRVIYGANYHGIVGIRPPFSMKPSEVLRIMREKIETVPPSKINLEHYRSTSGQMRLFRSVEKCGAAGCVIGWAATTPELAPMEHEFVPARGFKRGKRLHWIMYSKRILDIEVAWHCIPLYAQLFNPLSYAVGKKGQALKDEIINRLARAEIALMRNDEKHYEAYNTFFHIHLEP